MDIKTKIELKKKRKNIKKLNLLITKNSDSIKDILVSELFLKQIMDVSQYIDVELIEDSDGEEILFLFGKQINISHFINDGCILMMKDDSFVVLKSI